MPINPIIQSRTRYFRTPPTRDIMLASIYEQKYMITTIEGMLD
jgi:hypothetical protein